MTPGVIERVDDQRRPHDIAQELRRTALVVVVAHIGEAVQWGGNRVVEFGKRAGLHRSMPVERSGVLIEFPLHRFLHAI